MKLLSRGNTKLAKSTLCWSITPVKSCLNCSQCKKSCYAKNSYERFPKTKDAWDRNLEKAADGSFIDHVIEQIRKSKKCEVVRIHVAGDFFSKEYIKMWSDIIDMFPHITFYGYSKVFHIFPTEIESLNNKTNCNIINSIAEDGLMNFGKQDRCDILVSKGYNLCPVTKENHIVCGTDCKICLTEAKVCFKIHGRGY